MSRSPLRESLQDLADSAPDRLTYAWGPAVRARAAAPRRRLLRLSTYAAPAMAVVVAVALVLPQLDSDSGERTRGVAGSLVPDPDWVIPAALPALDGPPQTLAEAPIEAASMLAGWYDGSMLRVLLLGAAGEGYRLLPGEQEMRADGRPMPDLRCRGGLSPDGTHIACATDGQVALTELASGAVATLAAPGLRESTAVTWSPDGALVAYIEHYPTEGDAADAFAPSDQARLHVVPVSGGDPRAVELGMPTSYSFAWTPDSSQIVVGGQAVEEFEVVDVAARSVSKLQFDPTGGTFGSGEPFLVAPHGRSLVWFEGNVFHSAPLDGSVGTSMPVQGLAAGERARIVGFHGTSVVFELEDLPGGTLLVFDPVSGRLEPLVSHPQDVAPGVALDGEPAWMVTPLSVAQGVLLSARVAGS